jgi:hypothetical protein
MTPSRLVISLCCPFELGELETASVERAVLGARLESSEGCSVVRGGGGMTILKLTLTDALQSEPVHPLEPAQVHDGSQHNPMSRKPTPLMP